MSLTTGLRIIRLHPRVGGCGWRLLHRGYLLDIRPCVAVRPVYCCAICHSTSKKECCNNRVQQPRSRRVRRASCAPWWTWRVCRTLTSIRRCSIRWCCLRRSGVRRECERHQDVSLTASGTSWPHSQAAVTDDDRHASPRVYARCAAQGCMWRFCSDTRTHCIGIFLAHGSGSGACGRAQSALELALAGHEGVQARAREAGGTYCAESSVLTCGKELFKDMEAMLFADRTAVRLAPKAGLTASRSNV